MKKNILKHLFLQGILLFLIGTSPLIATPPSLELYSPPEAFVTSKNIVLFKGKVSKDTLIFLNELPLLLDNNGEFFVKQKLTRPAETFFLKAITSTGEETRMTRTVEFKGTQHPITQVQTKKSAPITATNPTSSELPIPIIIITSPENNFVTYKDSITISGQVTSTEEFYINSKRIPVEADGSFQETVSLNELGKNIFNFNAMGANNINASVIRKIFKVTTTPEEPTVNATPINPLEKKVALNISGTNIKDVLEILATKGELNVVSNQTLTGEVNISLTDVTILDAIDLILTTQGLSYQIIENTIIVASIQNLNSPSRLMTKILRVQNLEPTNILPVIKTYLSPNETAETVAGDNTIILYASPRKIDALEKIIKNLDAPRTPQVFIEAYILEINKTALDNIGVAWSSSYGVGYANTIVDGVSSYTAGFSLQTVINMLESSGQAKILAKPRLKAINKEEAEIFIGDEVPYTELTIDPAGRTTETVKYVNSGINLRIKPYINIPDNEIKIKVDPEVSYINGYSGSNNNVPIVRTRRVSTTVYVKNGNTVFIGGLFNSSDANAQSRFPLLGKTPIIGKLFSSERNVNSETELVIAITPQIMDIDSQEPFLISDGTSETADQ